MSGSWNNAGGSTSSTSVTIPSLQPSTQYDLEVVATNPGGTATSSTVTATTLAGVAPSTPANLVITGVSSAGTIFTWAASTGSAPVNYQLQYQGSAGAWVNIGTTTTGTTQTVSGLTAGQSYSFRLIATNNYGSATSSIYTATVPGGIAPSAPFGVVVSGIGPNSATVKWSPSSVGTGPVSYQVYVRQSGSVAVPSITP